MASQRDLSTESLLRWFVGCYGLFLLYGSLMPFAYQSRGLGDALGSYLGLDGGSGAHFSGTDFVTNIGIFIPMGFILAALFISRLGRSQALGSLAAATGLCLSLSATIEFLQLFFPPRVSWMYDLLANGLGGGIGSVLGLLLGRRFLALLKHCSAAGQGFCVRIPVWWLVGILPLYGFCLCWANNWFSERWLSWQEAVSRLSSINFLPFFYHQEASTWVALASVGWHFVWYLPVGGLLMLTGLPRLRRPVVPALLGLAIAAIVEVGKAFLAAKHPDSGNLVIGALAAQMGSYCLPAIFPVQSERREKPLVVIPTEARAATAQPSTGLTFLAFGLMVSVSIAVAGYPFMPVALGASLAGYALVLCRFPHVWVWLVPATLPVLDLAPYSGRFFLDEFDLMVLVTVAVSAWNRRFINGVGIQKDVGYWLTFLFAGSAAISLVVGLLPLTPLGPGAFSHYFSHFNALRVAKGVFLSLAMGVLLVTSGEPPGRQGLRYLFGMVLGLVGATALAVWERLLYPGFWNFSSEFRVGAFFSSMHNGGSHIEAYFVMAMPFLFIALRTVRGLLLRGLLASVFLAASYVVFVTYARGGYGAYGVVVLMACASLARVAYLEKRWRIVIAVAGLAMSAILFAIPASLGGFAAQRLASSAADLDTRRSHWAEAYRLMAVDPLTTLFGMGLGRFPESYFFGNRELRQPALFRYGRDDSGNGFLTLGAGDPLYVEQIVDVATVQNYRLSVDIRGARDQGGLNVLLCERTYFYSFGCVSAEFKYREKSGEWVHHEVQLYSGSLGAGTWLARRAVKLSLENPENGTIIDVDNLKLVDASGTNLLTNGDFQKGSDHWFFESPFNHLPWHIKNLWLGLLFDQGWVGMLSFLALVAWIAGRLGTAAWRGDLVSGMVLASLAGFLSVGIFDSLFDAPRLVIQVMMSLFASGYLLKARQESPSWLKMPARKSSEVGGGMQGASDSVEVPSESLPGGDPGHPRENRWYSRVLIWHALIGIVLVGFGIAAMTRIDAVPYHVRSLPNPFHPVFATLVLALFFYWVFALPAWLGRLLQVSRRTRAVLPLFVVLHGVVAWTLVRNGVLPEMIHKVAGFPVLAWDWEWETLLRFGVLEATLFLLLTGGGLFSKFASEVGRVKAQFAWLLWAVILLPISHYVIVDSAATDNLVELMARGGDALASLIVASWVILLGQGAAIAARGIAGKGAAPHRSWLVAALSIPVGYVLLSFGLESSIDKLGQQFSGLQFILSADRSHYATGWSLWLRYVLFHGGLLVAIAFAQYPLWMAGSARNKIDRARL